jgi:hypothetical protein
MLQSGLMLRNSGGSPRSPRKVIFARAKTKPTASQPNHGESRHHLTDQVGNGIGGADQAQDLQQVFAFLIDALTSVMSVKR